MVNGVTMQNTDRNNQQQPILTKRAESIVKAAVKSMGVKSTIDVITDFSAKVDVNKDKTITSKEITILLDLLARDGEVTEETLKKALDEYKEKNIIMRSENFGINGKRCITFFPAKYTDILEYENNVPIRAIGVSDATIKITEFNEDGTTKKETEFERTKETEAQFLTDIDYTI